MWNVIYDSEFEEWFEKLSLPTQEDVAVSIQLLEKMGPTLPRPHSDTVNGSKYRNMKELRVQSSGSPYRVFYAFDPKRNAVLLIGGCKVGKEKRFYKQMIPLADKLFKEYLEALSDD